MNLTTAQPGLTKLHRRSAPDSGAMTQRQEEVVEKPTGDHIYINLYICSRYININIYIYIHIAAPFMQAGFAASTVTCECLHCFSVCGCTEKEKRVPNPGVAWLGY